jgi:hypothetical protein
MIVKKHKKRLLPLFLAALLIVNIIIYAPRYLLYSSDYRKVDAIVLFLGPDFLARQKGANKLINEGMADYLIVPAYHKVYRIADKGSIKSLSPDLSLRRSMKERAMLNPAPYYYEDTHVEAVEARKMMSDYKLKSAIFVSSPYHMRRIKLIVGNVFTGKDGQKGGFYFVPTMYEKAPRNFWELTLTNWKKVGWEYIKITWFCFYILWPE